jgi:hypothetical protein
MLSVTRCDASQRVRPNSLRLKTRLKCSATLTQLVKSFRCFAVKQLLIAINLRLPINIFIATYLLICGKATLNSEVESSSDGLFKKGKTLCPVTGQGSLARKLVFTANTTTQPISMLELSTIVTSRREAISLLHRTITISRKSNFSMIYEVSPIARNCGLFF